jgi:hypothetical protein
VPQSPARVSVLARLDHLVYAAPSLDQGMSRIESLLGVRPTFGGRHPRYGTHNALLSLGLTTYLEVIALDPQAAEPAVRAAFGLDDLAEPRLTTWALRTSRIERDAAAATAGAATSGLGAVEAGARETADGILLSWRLTDPSAMPLEGAVPFLIDWGATPHPAGTAPAGGELITFRIEHPHPDKVRSALAALGALADVEAGDRVRLVATIRTARGVVELW